MPWKFDSAIFDKAQFRQQGWDYKSASSVTTLFSITVRSVTVNIVRQESSPLLRPDSLFSDSLFNAFWRYSRALPSLSLEQGADDNTLSPRVDVREAEKHYQVDVELPGVPKENIEVSVDDGVLTITARVEKETQEEQAGQVIHAERYAGDFMRRIDLGSDTASDGIVANLKEGVLQLTIPKLEGRISQPVKVPVS
jgi:HSP20 family protein